MVPLRVTPRRRENSGRWPAVTPGPGCAGRCRAVCRGPWSADVTAPARVAWEAVAAVVRWRRFLLAGLTP